MTHAKHEYASLALWAWFNGFSCLPVAAHSHHQPRLLFTHPFPSHQEYEVEDNYEIPDRKIDPAKLAPPLDHDLYTQNEMKKKFGKRYGIAGGYSRGGTLGLLSTT